MQTLTILRIENEKGQGPWAGVSYNDSYIDNHTLIDIGSNIPEPIEDYLPICSPNNYRAIFSSNKHFGFPSYEAFRKCVGNFEDEILPYLKLYKSSDYLISKSGLQVVFTKEVNNDTNTY